MAQPIDLSLIAGRLSAAAERITGTAQSVSVEVTASDLVFILGGGDAVRGTHTTESVPFGVLFHDEVDRVSQALDRLEARAAQAGEANTSAGS